MTRRLALVALTIALLLAATGSASARHYDSLLAPATVCSAQTDTRRSVDDQERTMRCMHNPVRSKRGLPSLITRNQLTSAAGAKSADIVHCQEFAHEACGRYIFYWTKRRGYASGCWGGGENIAWGSGSRLGPGDHERVSALRSPPPQYVQAELSRQGRGARKGHVPGLFGLPGVDNPVRVPLLSCGQSLFAVSF